MTDDTARTISALAELIASFAWPVVALIVLWWFGTSIRGFLSGVSEGTFKGFGFEATATRAAVTEALVTAESKSLSKDEVVEIRHSPGVGKSWRLADFVVNSGRFEKLHGRAILWVDDEPANNLSERLALTSLGLRVELALTTQQALADLNDSAFDVIVSDMQREENVTAGYDFLGQIKSKGVNVPLIFYRSSHSPKLEAEAVEKGAFGSTNEAVDLIILIANALQTAGKIDLGSDSRRRLRELRNLLVHKPVSSYRKTDP